MNIKKTVKIIVAVIIFIIIALLIVYFVKSKKFTKSDESSDLKDKVAQELYFLDDYIISMANSVNNINLEPYIVKSETISGQSSKEDNSSNSSSGNKSEGETSNSNSSESSSSSETSTKEESLANSYVLEPSDILVNDGTPDWESLKIAIEKLYTTWPTVVVDLYKLNIDVNTVQNFSKDLDNLTNSIKAEDKHNTLMYISKLYNYLPIFGTFAYNNLNNNMISTKANIVNAYALIEEQKWDEMKSYINKAEEEYMKLMNNSDSKNKYNINKAYIMLKEFQNSIDNQNIEVLYIKYKNLLNELNIINI